MCRGVEIRMGTPELLPVSAPNEETIWYIAYYAIIFILPIMPIIHNKP